MAKRPPAIHLRSRAGSAVAVCGRPVADTRRLAYRREMAQVTCGHCRRSRMGRAAIAELDPPPPPPSPPPADPALRLIWTEGKFGPSCFEGRSEDGWAVSVHPLGLAGVSVHAIDPEKRSHFHHRIAGVPRAQIRAEGERLYAEIRADPTRRSPERLRGAARAREDA